MLHPTPRKALALAFVILLAEGYDQFTAGTVGPALLHYRAWGATTGTIGLIGSATTLGAPIGSLAAGWSMARRGLRAPLLGAITWITLTMLAAALAPNLPGYIAARFATGIGIGALLPVISTLVSAAAPARRRSFWLAVALGGIAFGGTISALAGRIFLTHVHFQTLFLPGLLGLLLLPLVWVTVPADPVVREEPPYQRFAEVLAPRFRRTTVLYWLAGFMGLALVYSTSSWLPTTMVKAGYDLGSSLDFTLAFTLGAGLGTMGVALLADRISPQLAALGCFALAVVTLFVLSTPQQHWVLIAVSALAGIGALGVQNMLIASMAAFYPARVRGAGLGLALAVGRAGAILGPTYVGVVTGMSTSPKAGFYAFMVLALLGAVAVAAVPRRRQVEPVPEPTAVGGLIP